MTTDTPLLNLTDLTAQVSSKVSAQGSRAASLGIDLLQKPAVGLASARLAGAKLKPQEVVGFLRVHAARTRRRALPLRTVTLEVLTPAGARAVEITFQET